MSKAEQSWMRLDNAAKIYPASMRRDWMAMFRLSATLVEPVDPEVLRAALARTLTQDPKMDKERLDEIVDLMLETVCSARKTLRIAGDDYPAELVKSKFLKLNSSHIEFVMDCMRENTTKIRNIKQYLRAVLFNAPSTIDNYYTALVAHDMASPDWGKPKSGIPDYSCSPDESL